MTLLQLSTRLSTILGYGVDATQVCRWEKDNRKNGIPADVFVAWVKVLGREELLGLACQSCPVYQSGRCGLYGRGWYGGHGGGWYGGPDRAA